MSYTVIGDVVNVAARLQGEARAGEVLITEDTFRLVADHVETEELGSIYVKGRLAPVTMYKVTAVRGMTARTATGAHQVNQGFFAGARRLRRPFPLAGARGLDRLRRGVRARRSPGQGRAGQRRHQRPGQRVEPGRDGPRRRVRPPPDPDRRRDLHQREVQGHGPAVPDAVEKALKQVQDVEGVSRVRSFYSTGLRRLVSEDEHTTYAVDRAERRRGRGEGEDPGDPRRAAARPLARTSTRRTSSGSRPSRTTSRPGSAEDLHHAELYSLPLTIFLLLLVFGTIVAAGLPGHARRGGGGDGAGLLYLVALRMETSIFAMNTASMIGLGLGIDFSLLMVEPLPRGAGEGR